VNSVNPLAFYVISLVIVVTAMYAVSSPKLLNAALGLALSFFTIGGLYALLGSPFLTILQVLVNAGAIPIVTVFIIMMTQSRLVKLKNQLAPFLALAALALVALPMFGFLFRFRETGAQINSITPTDTATIGKVLMGSPETTGQIAGALLAFEVASVILLVAMIGAIVLAKRDGEAIKGDMNLVTGIDTPVAQGQLPAGGTD
jgi:NADH-quinone oxidoreductase subunit J